MCQCARCVCLIKKLMISTKCPLLHGIIHCVFVCQVCVPDQEDDDNQMPVAAWDHCVFVCQVCVPDQEAGADSEMPEALFAGLHGGAAGLHARPPPCPDPASCLLTPHAAPGQRQGGLVLQHRRHQPPGPNPSA